MGLNLQRKNFLEWVETGVRTKHIDLFLNKLRKHVGKPIDISKWNITDEKYPKVGSYTAYNVFILCLAFITEGDYESELDPDEDIELAALHSFRNNLKPASNKIPFVEHFLDVGDSSTIFIPVLFKTAFEFDEIFVASSPAAMRALETFSKILKFDLNSSFDDEGEILSWIPIATAKNVARIIYQFLKEKPDACVAFV